MKQLTILFAISMLVNLHAWSQTQSVVRVKGRIIDKDNQQQLAAATIALFRSKDSSTVATSLTDSLGAFSFDGMKVGSYLLYVTFVGYQSVLQALEITARDTLVDLRAIPMKQKGMDLKTVTIVQLKAPIVIKRDTLEFNAAHFKTRENALLEELLRKLPGVQIDKDGTVQINGQPIKRILVNGESFFGDDSKMAIRNLPADIIDKIQLIDKRFDQAQFGGVEDWKKEKVINITVRKDKKGLFIGHGSVSYGTDGRFAGNGHLSRFTDSEQMSFLASGNNINGYQEGQIRLTTGNGIIRNWNGGVNYNKDVNRKLKVTGSYIVNNSYAKNESSVARQNLLPDAIYYYNQNNYSDDNSTYYNLDIRTEYKFDTMHMISISGGFRYSRSKSFLKNFHESLKGSMELVNRGYMQNTNSESSPIYNITTLLEKKFKKTGRLASFNFSLSSNNFNQKNFNKSDNLFFQPDGQIHPDILNQRNDIGNSTHSGRLSITYTEPVFKKSFIDLSFVYNTNYASSEKYTYDYNISRNIYDNLNDSLSNSFRNNYFTQTLSLNFRTRKEKYEYSLGALVQASEVDNYNISRNNRINLSLFNYFPIAVIRYIFNSNKRLQFSYSGAVQPPSPQQLQPVPDNSNPLYVQLGNPDLKPTVSQSYSLWYNALNTVIMRSISASGNVTLYSNRIINANWFDSLGRQVSQLLNVSGTYNASANILNVFPLRVDGFSINTNTAFSLNRDINFINGDKGTLHSYNFSQELAFNCTYKDILNLTALAGMIWNGVRYSKQRSNNSNYFNYNLSTNFSVSLPIGLTIGSNVDYMANAGRVDGHNQNGVVLNVTISKSLFQYKQGVIKLQGFDLLSQNLSITRNVGENYIEDIQGRTLKRFFLLGFSYYLKKKDNSR